MRCAVDRNEANAKQKKYRSLDRLIKDAYGLNPTQMKLRMEWAQQEARSEHPLNGRPLKEPPEDGFQTILAKMEARGITPRVMADFDAASQRRMQDEESWGEGVLPHEKDRVGSREDKRARVAEVWESVKMVLQRPVKTAGVVVAGVILIAAMLVVPRIDAIATRRFSFDSRVRDGNTGTITWNNQDDRAITIGSLDEIYLKIKQESNVLALKLNYIPAGMKLSDYDIKKENVRLELTYKDNHIFLFEVIYSIDNTYTRTSDCQEYTTVFNEWIGQDISIQRNELSDNKFEYIAHLETNNTYYYIQGIMPEDEFLKVVENLVFEN